MRLTDSQLLSVMNNVYNVFSAITVKLHAYENIEDEIGIDFYELFSSEYEQCYDMHYADTDDKNFIYFCGDSFYGYYTPEEFLQLIKDMISIYRGSLKIRREQHEKTQKKD